MRYTVKDVSISHIIVEFEDATIARVPIYADWTLETIEREISKFFRPKIEQYKSIQDIPIGLGHSNDIPSYNEYLSKQEEIRQKKQEIENKIKLEQQEKKEIVEREKGFKRRVEYTEMRRTEYPSVEDQLDALYWSRNGRPELLEELDRKIAAVKQKYPTDMQSTSAVEFYGAIPKVMIDGELVEVPIDAL